VTKLKQLKTDGAPLNGDVVTFNSASGQFVASPPAAVGAGVTEGTWTCPIGAAPGDVVYVSAADNVDLGDANDPLKQPIIGIIKSKPGSTTAIVQYYGEMVGVLTGLTAGDTLYLSESPGQPVVAAPSGSGSIVQKVGFVKNGTTVVIMVDRDFTELA